MRKRGLRRYFQNLQHQELPGFLDFSGSEKSWFDFYHLHIDNTGLGNRSWQARRLHLEALFGVAEMVLTKLRTYPGEYLFWIEVDENDSLEDAVYMHTRNPNRSQFPFKVVFDDDVEIKNPTLLNYLIEKDYLIEKKKLIDAEGKIGTTYFLYKAGLGIEIK